MGGTAVVGLHSILWYLTVATALAGGGLSLAAYRARAAGPNGARSSNRLYLLSYILMSVSIGLFAAGGLLR